MNDLLDSLSQALERVDYAAGPSEWENAVDDLTAAARAVLKATPNVKASDPLGDGSDYGIGEAGGDWMTDVQAWELADDFCDRVPENGLVTIPAELYEKVSAALRPALNVKASDLADELRPLADHFAKLAETSPGEHPRNLDGIRPFSTGDVKHFAQVLPAIIKSLRSTASTDELVEKVAQIAYRVCAETRHVSLGLKAADEIRTALTNYRKGKDNG